MSGQPVSKSSGYYCRNLHFRKDPAGKDLFDLPQPDPFGLAPGLGLKDLPEQNTLLEFVNISFLVSMMNSPIMSRQRLPVNYTKNIKLKMLAKY